MKEETNNKFSGKSCLAIISFILLVFKEWKFINNPGSDAPIFSILFNMIIYLGLIIFIFHKKELTDEFHPQISNNKI